MPSEPQPIPTSKLPRAGDMYGAGPIPAPTDQDLTVCLVWHPHKLGANNGGWVMIQIPFGKIFDLPINTADSIGLINQVKSAEAAALGMAAQTKKHMTRAQRVLAAMQSILSAANTAWNEARRWAGRSQKHAFRSEDRANLTVATSSRVQAQVLAIRRQFSDSRLVGLSQSMARPRPERQSRPNDKNSVLASQIFGS